MSDNTKIVKTYYSLRAAVLVLGPLCKNSMTNPSVSCEVDIAAEKLLKIRMTRPGYNSTGYYEGLESCTFGIPCTTRMEVTGQPGGIYDDIDRWVLDLDRAFMRGTTHPAEYRSNDDDDVCCEGYFPPDEDFWWEEFRREVQSVIEDNTLHYEFTTCLDGESGRFWRITGELREYVWNLDELGTGAGSWDKHITDDLDGFSA